MKSRKGNSNASTRALGGLMLKAAVFAALLASAQSTSVLPVAGTTQRTGCEIGRSHLRLRGGAPGWGSEMKIHDHGATPKANEVMENSDTVTYLSFKSSWQLTDRPRRIALLVDDAQEEYRSYAKNILPNLEALVKTFRENDKMIVWSTWSRVVNDGIHNAMDRYYGPQGITSKQNALYIYEPNGRDVLKEIEPKTEVEKARTYGSLMLDMFWCFDENGESRLDKMLKAEGIDTIVLTGLWTDECICSTAYAGLSRGYDVVVVADATATATAHQDKALTIMAGTSSLVKSTAEVVRYMQTDFKECAPGAFKGVKHPDGRVDA